MTFIISYVVTSLMIMTTPTAAFNNSFTQFATRQQSCKICNTNTICMSKEKEDNLNCNQGDSLGRDLGGLKSSALKDTIEVGDMVVCKLSNPDLGIYENTSYELQSIYAQSFNDETQSIVKLPLNELNDPIPTGSTLYVTLFSPSVHNEAVVVSPQEVGLSSVRNELSNAAWLAVPGFFWVFIGFSFYNTYHERTGGSFMDAFWGR